VHNFIKVPQGATLLELLGAKDELPSIGRKSSDCTSCLKPFTAARKMCGQVRATSAELGAPVIFLYRLCRACTRDLKEGGEKETAVLAAVEKFIYGEVSQ
jgi:hypothetical protein